MIVKAVYKALSAPVRMVPAVAAVKREGRPDVVGGPREAKSAAVDNQH